MTKPDPIPPGDIESSADLVEAPVDFADEDGARHASIVVKKEPANRRLDQYLSARFPRFSRSRLQRLIDAGAVTLNGRPGKASRKISAGDVIDVILPPPPVKEIRPEAIPIEVIWEDEHFLAINKQAGLLVHPARGNPHGTLVNALMHYAGKLSAGADPFRPGIVHRLDRNTTGIMLVAKTDEAHWRLARQFETRRIYKQYIAVVHGALDLAADRIDAPLARHRFVREKYQVDALNPDAKPAVTTYRVKSRYRGFTVVQLEPKTGRTHQLRVHMAYVKHPIVSDLDYGGKNVSLADLREEVMRTGVRPAGASVSPRGTRRRRAAAVAAGVAPADLPLINRQALHAQTIRFHHPVSDEPMELTAPLPADMQALLAALEQFRKL